MIICTDLATVETEKNKIVRKIMKKDTKVNTNTIGVNAICWENDLAKS